MLIVLLITAFLVSLCVLVHYEALAAVTRVRDHWKITHRRWIINLILWALVAHIIEISLFAVAYSLLDSLDWAGSLVSSGGGGSTDYWYFSAVAYTSLGFGDITPQGPIRFMVGVQTLTGLVLIAWTSSLVFVEMQSSWSRPQPPQD